MGALRFETDGGYQWKVVFQHGMTTREVGKKKQEVPVRFTTAIVDLTPASPWSDSLAYMKQTIGMTLCSPSDQFCRKTGRKIALQRALVEYSRETRAAFWQEYWRSVGKMEFINGHRNRQQG